MEKSYQNKMRLVPVLEAFLKKEFVFFERISIFKNPVAFRAGQIRMTRWPQFFLTNPDVAPVDVDQYAR